MQIPNYCKSIFLLFMLFGSSNCASFFRNASTRLEVVAPEGSSIYLNQEKIGDSYTFKKINLPDREKAQAYELKVELTGNKPKNIALTTERNPWIWGNFLFLAFSPVGFAVDYFAGGFERYTPLEHFIEFEPDASFKENKNSSAYLKYQKELEASKTKETLVTNGNLANFILIQLDEKGNEIKEEGLFSKTRLGEFGIRQQDLKSGKYKVLSMEDYENNKGKQITYTTKKEGEDHVIIPGGGVAVLCRSESGRFRVLHISEKNLQEFEFVAPRKVYADEISNKCGYAIP
ncbi:MAG: hypothetical protein O9264_06145 [Leptospira sp.]|nr:hypothetical protein [Leptospira sp.]